MTPATLTVAVGDYDHTRDLVSRLVSSTSVAATFVPLPSPEEMFARVLDGGEFDAAEMSLAVLVCLLSRGDDAFTALPVFPARSFRHSAIFTRADGPTTPTELAGCRIGIPAWVQTAGVYARGILASDHGVSLEGITWIQAGVDAPGRTEPIPFDYGPFDVTPAPSATLDQLLLDGTVDAVISARPPACIRRGNRKVRPLFLNPVAEELRWYTATGVFPIMHILVIRTAVARAHPEAARGLYAAFNEAKRRSLIRISDETVPSVPLPWVADQARKARKLFGDDWWPYGIKPNRSSLDTFLRHAHEQYLTATRLAPEDLFDDEFVASAATI
jgi:4,5-dihydroxyphthalate decarboxylase